MNNESTDSKQPETSNTGAPTLHRRENSPDHSIRADGPVGQGGDASATIHDRTGLYIAILALLVAGMALGFEISRAMSESNTRLVEASNRAEARERELQAIDAKIVAGAAKAEATAQAAKEHARIALDEVNRAVAQLEAKGLVRASH